ncbi:MAG: archaemetzincin family Zn-dependent metalloprotease [Acidobacteria bacterium]|nr:archaemetzincin family Zn-dependent metalloprotease [Acidobacteriota bacterium]MBI3656915.1 archaemetzincin family Zn-dependent metalloprotease [Acidobacteriota bacterium]
MSVIALVPIHTVPATQLEHLARGIREILHCETALLPRLEAAAAYEAARNQYNSTTLLAHLLPLRPPHSAKILGITELDLFIPILTYVFGEAQLSGAAAVVSSFRLRNELYGLPADPTRLRQRLLKEANHELGHTFGLIHCRNVNCVMHPSTYAEDIDLKAERFCEECWKEAFESVH